MIYSVSGNRIAAGKVPPSVMLLKEIRNRTAENHARLENTPLLSPFAHQRIDLPSYLEILRRFYGYFAPLESLLDTFPALITWLPDYTERRKAKLLLDDLNTLNSRTPINLCEKLPVVRTEAHAFGCLYVMEGSTLGGKLIYTILRKQLNLDNMRGASFFYGYGPETGTKWKAFGASLEAFATDRAADEEIIAAADDTFLKLEQWMQIPK